MTTFNLSAGRPTTYQRGRPSASPPEEELKRMSYWAPNMERDTPLACGDLIPWPIIQAFGQHIHGQIWCETHGWQPKITKAEIERSQRETRKAEKCTPPSTPTLQDPPF